MMMYTRRTKRDAGHTSSKYGVVEAHKRGLRDALRGFHRNSYPKGYRHDAYEQALSEAKSS